MDCSGYPVFSQGDQGAAHLMAHRLLDAGRHTEGHRALGGWLARNPVHGSEGVHLHWHMLVFELATGRWDQAWRRFEERVLPLVPEDLALTDAPSALWRLRLCRSPSRTGVPLPWAPVREAALRHLARDPDDGATTLHSLLALAGAGDALGLARFRRGRSGRLVGVARGLEALALGDPTEAHAHLDLALVGLGHGAGSHAQGRLLEDLRAHVAQAAA